MTVTARKLAPAIDTVFRPPLGRKMLHMPFRPLIVLLGLALSAGPVLGWNKAGHMVSGAIAFDLLKQDSPETIAKVTAVLRHHPQYDLFAQRLESVPEEDRDRYLFMLAARWADDVRSGSGRKYHRGPWHYVNLPVTPTTGPATAPVSLPAPAADNIITAYRTNLDVLAGDAPDAEKAVALCWVFHLVGDVHQPLHTVSLFSEQFPGGDRGGNLFLVRAREGGAAISLHTFWDGLILGSDRYRAAANEAVALRLRPEFAREKLHELTRGGFEAWAMEGVELARDVAYRHGALAGSEDKTAAPVLPDGYAATAKEVAERRIVVAGYRLARELESVVR